VRLEEFDYHLPPSQIAQTPIEPRDAARMLVDRGHDGIEHRHVRDLPSLLCRGDLLVVNESKVIPARLRLRRATGGAAEVLLLEPQDGASQDGARWEALVRPARKLRQGELLLAEDGIAIVRIGSRGDDGTRFVEIVGSDVPAVLERYGEMPLPPYITTPLTEPDRYQTVYARLPGSAAAPTAGLHLTAGLLGELADAGVEVAPVELIVGLDTFAPITQDDPEQHHIHTERYRVPAETLRRARGAARVVAVGTTAVRALESAATSSVLEGRTDLFIRRGHDWKLVDVLLTNFHLPRTTLLMMVDAFIGARWRRLYETALAEGYRFASFGDAMLLERPAD